MRLRIVALAIALGLGAVGYAAADESSSWLPRWLSPWSGKDDKSEKIEPVKTPIVKDDGLKMPPTAAFSRKKQAQADLDRRREVLDRVREFAVANDDEETLRKVDLLEQRAWDVYRAAVNMNTEPARVSVETNAKKGSR